MSKFKTNYNSSLLVVSVLNLHLVGIDWANGPYVMETAINVTGGINYSVKEVNQISKNSLIN